MYLTGWDFVIQETTKTSNQLSIKILEASPTQFWGHEQGQQHVRENPRNSSTKSGLSGASAFYNIKKNSGADIMAQGITALGA